MRHHLPRLIFCLLVLPGARSALPSDAINDCTCTLTARRDAVNSVVARLRLTLHNRIKKQAYVLNGSYLCDAAGNLRLRITAESGQLVLDLGARCERIDMCIPDKGLFVSGLRADLSNAPQSQLALQIGRASCRERV